ncbi:S-layer homology domain-containing protein [Chakrabartyella piscis]|uniref:S-layer homology domain-containing protein n=1 Tax=Chakrabartyella piscis TaxID=2918914 RepID=UPI00295836E9|nr:S-layer homology domain-containing protein [Chakrabartyella piscis]
MIFRRKVITWLMALTMVFGLLPVQAFATEASGVSLELSDTKTNYSAGEAVSIDVNFTAEEETTIGGIEFYFNYDSEKLGIQQSYGFDDPFTYNSNLGFARWSVDNSAIDNVLTVTGGSGTYVVTVLEGETINIGTLNFVVLENGVIGEETISFVSDFEAAGLGSTTVNQLKTGDNIQIADVDFESSVSFNVVQEGITLAKSAVTVDGVTSQTVQAYAFDSSVTDITASATWSVEPDNGSVSVNAGLITVAEKAVAGKYTIKAGTYTADLEVSRTASVATAINWATVTTADFIIPANDTGNSVLNAFVVSVEDQFGTDITNPDVAWSITAVDGNDFGGIVIEELEVMSTDPITTSSATVTVTKEAAETILNTTGRTFTVTATIDGVSDSKTITVKRADSVLTSIEILKNGTAVESDTIAIPTGDDSVVSYSAQALDQYGSSMIETIQLSAVETLPTGISFDGVEVTVTKEAEPYEFTLKATEYDGGPITKEITIKVVDIDFQNVVVNEATATYGDTWAEIVTFDTTNWVAKVGDDTIAGTYTLQNATDIPDAGDQTYTIVFNSTNGDYVDAVAKSATVSIANAAMTDTTSKTQSATYTGSEISITEPSATTVNGQVIRVSYPNGDATSYTAADTYEIEYQITAPNHDTINDKITFTINKAGSEITPTPDPVDPAVDTSEISATYGETITLSVDVDPVVVADAASLLNIVAGDDTVAFYYEDTKLGEDTIDAAGGTASIDYPITSKTLEIGENQIDVYYGGGNNLNASNKIAVITVDLEEKDLSSADVDGIEDKDYTGSAITQDGLTVTDAQFGELTKDVDYEVEYDDHTDAGTATVTITGIGYFKGEIEKTFDIDPIDYDGTKEISGSAKYGNEGSVDLTAWDDLKGSDIEIDSVSDAKDILKSYEIDGAALVFELVDDVDLVGETATITLKVESNNYNDFELEVTITVLDKYAPELVVKSISKEYDGVAITDADIDGTATYAGNPVAGTWTLDTLDEIKNVVTGTYTVTFTPDDEGEYAVKSAEMGVTITKATITITADDKTVTVGGDEPEYTTTVKGLVTGEDLTTQPSTATCTPDMDTVGTYTIYVGSGAVASANYDIVYENGTLTVKKKSSTTSSYYIKVTVTGNGTVDPDGGADHMYEVTKGSDVEFEFDADSGYEISDVIVNGVSVGVCDEYEFENIIATVQTLEVVFTKTSSSSSSSGGSSSSSDDDDDEDDEDVDVDEDEDDDDADVAEIPFADVDEDDDCYEGVAYVYENGIMAGITSEEFGADYSITRAMIAAILYRINGSEPVDAEMLFGDVAVDQYYYDAVLWAKDAGVVAGVSATEFAPNTAITNEQFAAFLYRYASFLGMDMTISAGANLSDYADADQITSYAQIAMLWAVDKGIIGEDDTLNPTAEALRGAVANALMNFMELQ